MPGELGDQDVPPVADETWIQVLECSGVGLDARDMEAALVGEGVPADVGLVGIGRDVQELVDEVGRLGEEAHPLGPDDVVAELQLQGAEDRDEVRVAAALAVAVHRALDERRAGVDGCERVGDPALEVVVGVDPDRYVRVRSSRTRPRLSQ